MYHPVQEGSRGLFTPLLEVFEVQFSVKFPATVFLSQSDPMLKILLSLSLTLCSRSSISLLRGGYEGVRVPGTKYPALGNRISDAP